MIPLICPQNVNGASSYAAAPISSNSRGKPFTASPSTLFRSDLPPPDHEKTDEEPVGEFLWRGLCSPMGIKDSSPKQASLYKYTWEFVACIVIIGKGRSGLNIWPKTPNQDTDTENIILTTSPKEAMKRNKINLKQQYLPSPSPRKACYAVIQAVIRKTVMPIYLQILDSIMGFHAAMMQKIWGLVSIYYQLQSNSITLLCRLSDRHLFWDPELDKV